MSLSDFRRMVELHGGAYIGVECTDGSTVEIGVNGEYPAKINFETLDGLIIPRLRARMESMMHDGFKKMTFTFGQSSTELNYYDAGALLDVLRECVRYLR